MAAQPALGSLPLPAVYKHVWFKSVLLLVPKSTECYRDVNLILCSVLHDHDFEKVIWLDHLILSHCFGILSQAMAYWSKENSVLI